MVKKLSDDDRMLRSDFFSSDIRQLTVILVSYILTASILNYAYRFDISPDSIVFIRLSEHIVEGNYMLSVTGSWPPLMIWFMSPFLFFGFDGLTSMRIVVFLSGFGAVLSSWFLTLRFNLTRSSRFLVIMTATLLVAHWSTMNPGPNLLFTSFIVFYLYLVTNPEILEHKRTSFFCGIVCGLAYLSKHYAFPFFLVHFPMLLLLRGYIDKNNDTLPLKKLFTSFAAGIAGLFIITSMWITIVSVKYGSFTISSAGHIAHAIAGPKDVDRRPPPFYGGLHNPHNNFSLHIYEDPSGLEYKKWSPFDNKEYFIYQLKLIRENSIYILGHFVKQSPFFTYPLIAGILILIPLALFFTRLNGESKFLYYWLIITFAVYSSGLVLTFARSTKYFYPLMLTFLFISFHFLDKLIHMIKEFKSKDITERSRKLAIYYLIMVFTLAFTIKPGLYFARSFKSIISAEQVNAYKDIAEQISIINFPGPYAIIRSSQKPHTDLYIAYYLKKQFLGRPLSTDLSSITRELRFAGARSLLIFDNLELAEKFKQDKRYEHVASVKLKRNESYWNAVNIRQDDITGWDSEVSVFLLKN